MRLIRFMGPDEFRKYLAGEMLENRTVWSENGSRSTSKGFCFFPSDPPVETRLHYLSGIVDFRIVAEFLVVGCPRLTEGAGIYRDPRDRITDQSVLNALKRQMRTIKVKEYSLEAYSQKTLYLMRFGTVGIGPRGWELTWKG